MYLTIVSFKIVFNMRWRSRPPSTRETPQLTGDFLRRHAADDEVVDQRGGRYSLQPRPRPKILQSKFQEMLLNFCQEQIG